MNVTSTFLTLSILLKKQLKCLRQIKEIYIFGQSVFSTAV